jgi:hypothetical protein
MQGAGIQILIIPLIYLKSRISNRYLKKKKVMRSVYNIDHFQEYSLGLKITELFANKTCPKIIDFF